MLSLWGKHQRSSLSLCRNNTSCLFMWSLRRTRYLDGRGEQEFSASSGTRHQVGEHGVAVAVPAAVDHGADDVGDGARGQQGRVKHFICIEQNGKHVYLLPLHWLAHWHTEDDNHLWISSTQQWGGDIPRWSCPRTLSCPSQSLSGWTRQSASSLSTNPRWTRWYLRWRSSTLFKNKVSESSTV